MPEQILLKLISAFPEKMECEKNARFGGYAISSNPADEVYLLKLIYQYITVKSIKKGAGPNPVKLMGCLRWVFCNG